MKQRGAHALTRRTFLRLVGGATGTALLAACRGAEAPPANTPAPLVMRTPPPIALAQSTPVATAAPATAATVAPATGRPQPQGKLTEAWNSSIAPALLDPQEYPPAIPPYHFAYALHDALIKPMPGQPFAPSLAESYEIAPDFKSATFKLRKGIKFHDGSPVTPDDVKFTYEQYRGASASVLKAKLDHIDLPDERTVKYFFKEPFLDFEIVYGSPASGAAWIVPKAYYERVGKDGFKQAPIGAGPYRFVRQTACNEVESEAFPDYWRKTPNIKTIVIRAAPELATRAALLKTGEADVAITLQGSLYDSLRQDPNLRFTATRAAATWLELLNLDRPDHPLTDVRVRQAVSLAIDRKAINDAEINGLSPMEGNWVAEDLQGALQRPPPSTDLARAKQLMAEAGYSDGFEVSALTPIPPFISWGERVVTQLRSINIRTQLNVMERGAFYERLAPGPNRLKGFVLQFSSSPGDAAARIRENAVCQGSFSGLCLADVDGAMKKYDASTDVQERKQLLEGVQNYLLDQYVFVPLVRSVLVTGFGPRLAGNPEEYSGVMPQYIYIGPWEDLKLNA